MSHLCFPQPDDDDGEDEGDGHAEALDAQGDSPQQDVVLDDAGVVLRAVVAALAARKTLEQRRVVVADVVTHVAPQVPVGALHGLAVEVLVVGRAFREVKGGVAPALVAPPRQAISGNVHALRKRSDIYVTVNLYNQVICILPDFFS